MYEVWLDSNCNFCCASCNSRSSVNLAMLVFLASFPCVDFAYSLIVSFLPFFCSGSGLPLGMIRRCTGGRIAIRGAPSRSSATPCTSVASPRAWTASYMTMCEGNLGR